MNVNQQTLAEKSAQAAVWALSKEYPLEAPLLQSYLVSLFQALSDGHGYIGVNYTMQSVLAQAPHLVTRQPEKGLLPLVWQDDKLFLAKVWQLESDIAKTLLRKVSFKGIQKPSNEKIAALLSAHFPDESSSGQKLAAALALLNTIMVLMGGPGTGKTTTVAKILLMLLSVQDDSASPPNIALVAPTGKAAARMTEALHNSLLHIDANEADKAVLQNLQGMTLHRFLKIHPPRLQSPFNEHNPIGYDIVVVDEASMVDLGMMQQLLSALPAQCRLIVLGDAAQLPSVGTGAVLAALPQQTRFYSEHLDTLKQWLPEWIEKIPTQQHISLHMATVILTHSHRFDDTAGIGRLAKDILAGGESLAGCFADSAKSVTLEESSSDVFARLFAAQSGYWQAVANHDVQDAFEKLSEVLVLAVYRKDIERFNQGYRQYLCQKQLGNMHTWFEGQVIIMKSNDYGLNVFNGDVAIVMQDKAGQLQAYFPDAKQPRAVALSRLPDFEDAFAITVHKSQGSEATEVWLLGPEKEDDDATLFSQALLYTAVTRAKKRFVYWGSFNSFEAAAKRQVVRRSALSLWLKD